MIYRHVRVCDCQLGPLSLPASEHLWLWPSASWSSGGQCLWKPVLSRKRLRPGSAAKSACRRGRGVGRSLGLTCACPWQIHKSSKAVATCCKSLPCPLWQAACTKACCVEHCTWQYNFPSLSWQWFTLYTVKEIGPESDWPECSQSRSVLCITWTLALPEPAGAGAVGMV
jgi:hypothetical protein